MGKYAIIVVMKIRKTASRVKLALSCVIALACVVGLCFSGYKIIQWLIDSNSTKTQTVALEEAGDITEVDDDDETEVIPQKEEKRDSLYWKYLQTKLIDVDFTELKQQNREARDMSSICKANHTYYLLLITCYLKMK